MDWYDALDDYYRRWVDARVEDGTLVAEPEGPVVTDVGWSFIFNYGAAGSALENEELDKAFVIAANHSEVMALHEATCVMEAILLAVAIQEDAEAATVGDPDAEEFA